MVEQSKWAHFGSYAPDPAKGRPAGRSYPVRPILAWLSPRAIFLTSHAKRRGPNSGRKLELLPIVVNREVIGLEKFPSLLLLLLLVFEAFRGNRSFNERFNLRSRGK